MYQKSSFPLGLDTKSLRVSFCIQARSPSSLCIIFGLYFLCYGQVALFPCLSVLFGHFSVIRKPIGRSPGLFQVRFRRFRRRFARFVARLLLHGTPRSLVYSSSLSTEKIHFPFLLIQSCAFLFLVRYLIVCLLPFSLIFRLLGPFRYPLLFLCVLLYFSFLSAAFGYLFVKRSGGK
jgi:hypothetical protein